MTYPFHLHRPQLAKDVFTAPGARLVGQVRLGPGCSVWYNVVIRGDSNIITIGAGTNIQDNSVLHVDEGPYSLQIGENVTIGHGCILHGCTIGSNSLVGMGAIVLNGAVIGENSLVAAGSLVTGGKVFPPGVVLMGRPAQVARPVTAEDLAKIAEVSRHYQEYARAHAVSLV